MGVWDAMSSAARFLGRTTASISADVASATARAGQVATETVRGTTTHPATLRLTVLILSDESGAPLADPADLVPAITLATDVLQHRANIRLRHVATHVVGEPAPTVALDPKANKRLLLDEVIGQTAFYHRQLQAHPDTGSVTDVIGRPVTAIVVREIDGRTTGCSLGISADWVVVQAGLFHRDRVHEYDDTVLAHEIGHALNLPHHPKHDNLMYFSSSPPDDLRGTSLAGWQRAVMNANRHVVPGLPSD